ncbi:hypothetical protein B0A48_05371 [Cryoendolithus antarcticus]|uniref:Arginase n=1 Tax=Cryoendolithus antarcticus TaxID=1507870 RepID=A0A1V8TIC8_9PEZI|nr:hypothetical protein B0A48_05371 [Cryoendolithus antarcticus]
MVSPNTIAITSIPADIGSLIPGKRHAPAVLLKAGLAQGLAHVGYKTTSHNALPDGPAAWSLASIDPSGVKREKENVEVNHRVHEALTNTLKPIEADGRPPIQLILGGECCQLPGILTAFSHSLAPARVGLLYIDADADLTVPNAPGSSGNFASMTMTHLMRRAGGLESMASFVRPDGKPLVDAGNVVFFGLNLEGGGNTREQLSILFDGEYRVFTSSSIAAAPEERAREALAWLEDRVDVILVHYDVDSIDAGSFPLANVPQFTGVKIEDSLRAFTVLLGGPKIGGLMVAEVNPDHDPGLSMTGKLVEGIVDAFKARRKQPE